MKKLLKWHDAYTLKILVGFLLAFTVLYPKLPSIHIIRTWVYIRLEDFFILAAVLVWLIQVIRHKVTIPKWIGGAIASYWLVGLASLLFSIFVLAPQLVNFFPHIAALNYLRRIEYMILFFVAFSTIASIKDLRHYVVILSLTVAAVFIYGMGQKYYLFLWSMFPGFFENFSYCFPSFQTGNEEFAKGIPLCLPEGARITATFGGHYDLAAYLVVVVPIFLGIALFVKRWYYKLAAVLLYLAGLVLLLSTASRTSFMAYLIGAIFALIIARKKLYIIPVVLVSVLLLFSFSESTAQRILSTVRISSIVTNSDGQLVGEATSGLSDDLKKRISQNGMAIENPQKIQDLQKGSAFIGLPQAKKPKTTNTAVVQKTLSPEEAKRLQLADGSLQIATVSGTFLVQQALVYDISFTTRLQAEWPNAWNAFMRNPLLGSGYSSITLATDNDYFRALGETGALGLISFMMIFVVLGMTMRQLIPSVPSPLLRGFAFGLAGGVLGLCLNATLIDVFEASKVAENLWLLLGIAAGSLFLFKRKPMYYPKMMKGFLTSGYLLSLYLLLIILIVFLPSVSNFFLADDFTWLRWAADADMTDLLRYFTDAQNFFYRPLDKLVVFFLYNFSGFQPVGYHAFILMLHFFVCILVYFFIKKVCNSKLLGFAGSLLFALHPMHVENLYWFSTISVVMSTFFIMIAIVGFYWFRDRNSVLSYIVAFLASICAYLSYEMAVIIPLLFVVLDIFITLPAKKSIRTYLAYLPFIAMWPAYYLVRKLVHAFSGGGDYSYNLTHLLPNVIGNFFGYIGLFIGGPNFLPYYDMLRNWTREHALIVSIILLIGLLIIAAAIYMMRQKLHRLSQNTPLRYIAFGLSFAFVSLLPFLALGNIAPRYNYLAGIGFCIVFVVIIHLLAESIKKGFGWKPGVIVLITVGLLAGSYIMQQKHLQKDWYQGSEISRKALGIFRTDYEMLSPNSTLYFVNTPVKIDNVWIFPVGLTDGLWFIFREHMPEQVYQVDTLEEAEDAKTQGGITDHYIFQFDNEGTISEVK